MKRCVKTSVMIVMILAGVFALVFSDVFCVSAVDQTFSGSGGSE
jgi:hypothetical protein